VIVATLVACSDAFNQPSQRDGNVSAQTFATDSAGTTKNWITAGATLDLLYARGVV